METEKELEGKPLKELEGKPLKKYLVYEQHTVKRKAVYVSDKYYTYDAESLYYAYDEKHLKQVIHNYYTSPEKIRWGWVKTNIFGHYVNPRDEETVDVKGWREVRPDEPARHRLRKRRYIACLKHFGFGGHRYNFFHQATYFYSEMAYVLKAAGIDLDYEISDGFDESDVYAYGLLEEVFLYAEDFEGLVTDYQLTEQEKAILDKLAEAMPRRDNGTIWFPLSCTKYIRALTEGGKTPEEVRDCLNKRVRSWYRLLPPEKSSKLADSIFEFIMRVVSLPTFRRVEVKHGIEGDFTDTPTPAEMGKQERQVS